MGAATINLEIEQGSTFRQKFTYSAGTPPAPVNLTGCKGRMQIRAKVQDEQVLAELTTENGGVELVPLAGEITLNIDADTSAALSFRSGVYDFELEYSTGIVERLFEGKVTLSPEVTR